MKPAVLLSLGLLSPMLSPAQDPGSDPNLWLEDVTGERALDPRDPTHR